MRLFVCFILMVFFEAADLRAQSLPALIPYRKGDKWGYADSTGRIVVQPIYSISDTLSYGLAITKEANGPSHLFDKSGNLLFSSRAETDLGIRSNDTIVFEEGKYPNLRYGFSNLKGEIIVPVKYRYIRVFREGMAAVEENDKWGFINEEGKVVIKPKFERVDDFYEGCAMVETIARFGNPSCHQGLIDKNGNWILHPEYESIGRFYNGYIRVTECSARGTIDYDRNLHEVNFCPKEVQEPCWYPGLHVYRTGDKAGFVDSNGKLIIQPIYDQVNTFQNGYAHVYKNDKNGITLRGMINTKGKEIIPIAYTFVDDKLNEGYARVMLDYPKFGKKYGIIDTNGKYLVPLGQYPDNNDLGKVSGNMVKVCKPYQKCGYINTKGDTVIPFIYDGGSDVENGVIRYTLNMKMGIMDKKGKRITPPLYEKINEFHKGIAKVEDKGKTFFIDRYGRVYYAE